MELTTRLSIGYQIDRTTAEEFCKLYSLSQDTAWTDALEQKLNEAFGWDYDPLLVNAARFSQIKADNIQMNNKVREDEEKRQRLIDQEAIRKGTYVNTWADYRDLFLGVALIFTIIGGLGFGYRQVITFQKHQQEKELELVRAKAAAKAEAEWKLNYAHLADAPCVKAGYLPSSSQCFHNPEMLTREEILDPSR